MLLDAAPVERLGRGAVTLGVAEVAIRGVAVRLRRIDHPREHRVRLGLVGEARAVELGDVRMVRPVLHLERAPGGGLEALAPGAPNLVPLALPERGRLTVSDGIALIERPDGSLQSELDAIDLDLRADGERGPYAIQGDFAIAGVPFQLDLRLGRVTPDQKEYRPGGVAKLQEKHPALYGGLDSFNFPAFDATAKRVPDGTADAVLTFRNVHNWRMGYRREGKPDYSADAFKQMFAMLKPGGVLGIEDHRLPESADAEREQSSGYIKVSTVRQLAEAAGFRFVGSSEINANPKDSADWPNGVWTLPPSLRNGDADREKYLAIGESDRMTLKFVKPAK